MVNEHHSTPSCVNVSANMTAGILGRITRRAKILVLGNILPIQDNPVRIAEEIAMADLISGGRILSGFVRGVGVETWWANVNPVHNRERFEECHDLILKCWTEPGPFRWEGRHYHFRHVNPWCLPLQKPHPPVWIPGTASPETAIWAGQRGYTYVPFLVPVEIARELFDYYRQGAAEAGRTVTADNLGFLVCSVAADTEAAALEAGRHFVWRMGPTLRAPAEFFAPVGMQSSAARRFALKSRPVALSSLPYEDLVKGDFIIAGTPDYVSERFAHLRRELGIGHLLLEARSPHGPRHDDALDRADGRQGDSRDQRLVIMRTISATEAARNLHPGSRPARARIGGDHRGAQQSSRGQGDPRGATAHGPRGASGPCTGRSPTRKERPGSALLAAWARGTRKQVRDPWSS